MDFFLLVQLHPFVTFGRKEAAFSNQVQGLLTTSAAPLGFLDSRVGMASPAFFWGPSIACPSIGHTLQSFLFKLGLTEAALGLDTRIRLTPWHYTHTFSWAEGSSQSSCAPLDKLFCIMMEAESLYPSTQA